MAADSTPDAPHVPAPHSGAPAPERHAGSFLDGLTAEAKKIPPWAWVVIAVVAFIVVRNFFGTQNSTTAAPVADLANSDTGAAGGSEGIVSGDSGGTGSTGTGSSGGGPSAGGGGTGTKHPTDPTGGKSSGGGSSAKTVYTVRTGDTLAEIGQRYDVNWHDIYSANESVIEKTAQAHGFKDSGGGHWIFPGEKLVIP